MNHTRKSILETGIRLDTSPASSTSSSATVTELYISFPRGQRVRGPVKVIYGVDGDPTAHPGRGHRWFEMLHYGQPGTGFAECICGAYGVPYRLPHQIIRDRALGAIASMRGRFGR